MSDPKKPCDLCSLPVGVKPFTLMVSGKQLEFCCEGCLGIYQLLNEINEIPAPLAENSTTRS